MAKDTKSENKAVATTRPGELEPAPDFDFIPKGDKSGLEGMDRQDIIVPRLLLAQSMGPQMQRSDPKYMEELRVGDMFNDVTGRIYGLGPMEIAVVRRDPPKYVEFDRDKRGVVLDANVPHGDPRTKFGEDGSKPLATMFYEYLIAPLPLSSDDPINAIVALSMKGMNIKMAAKPFNTKIYQRQKPIYIGKYTIESVEMKNDKGVFPVFSIKNAGWITDAEVAKTLKAIHDAVKNKEINIPREDTGREPGDDTGEELGADM